MFVRFHGNRRQRRVRSGQRAGSGRRHRVRHHRRITGGSGHRRPHRTPEEFADGHIVGAVNIPVQSRDFSARIAELDPAATYAVYCRSGNRSQPAVAAMRDAGISTIYELGSGTKGWVSAGQPLVQ